MVNSDAPGSSRAHALLAGATAPPMGSGPSLLLQMRQRELEGAFWLRKLHGPPVALTALQAAAFCGGEAVEGCNCCCDDELVGPGTFLSNSNDCSASYCYDFNVRRAPIAASAPALASRHSPDHAHARRARARSLSLSSPQSPVSAGDCSQQHWLGGYRRSGGFVPRLGSPRPPTPTAPTARR